MKSKFFTKPNSNISEQVWIYCFMIIVCTFINCESNAQLLNGSFESPGINTNTNQIPANPDFWHAYPPGNALEIWNGALPGLPFSPQNDTQYLELNAFSCIS